MKSTQTHKFYSFIACPYAHRVRMMLEQLKIPYEYIEIDLLNNQQLLPQFKKINIKHKVPVLVYPNGEHQSESIEICNSLNEKYAKSVYTPTYDKKQFKEIMDTYDRELLRAFNRKNKQEIDRRLKGLIKGLNMLAQQSGLTKLWLANQKQATYFNDKYTLLEIFLTPLINQLAIISKHLSGINILSSVGVESEQERNNLDALNAWLNLARSRPCYIKSVYQIQKLPEVKDCPILGMLNMTDAQSWNFEKFYIKFVTEQFLSPQTPKPQL